MNASMMSRLNSKHEKIAIDHIASNDIEYILNEALKFLISQEALPSNPYNLLLRNVSFSKIR